jgi:large subunit ribosomal protein L31e
MSKASTLRSIHVIPLRRVYFGRRANRADRAVRLIRQYVARHFKEAERVVIDPEVNAYIWSRSRKKPPRRVVVEVRFDRENKVANVLLVRESKWRSVKPGVVS